MELREWATHILSANSLNDKLFTPDILTDHEPGSPLLFKEPTRPPGMHFQRHTSRDKLPPFHEHNHPDKRATCLHRFAGHELLAVEIMAQALLAFPDAPLAFRKGVAHTLKEEQEHVRLYVARMRKLGLELGDMPLYRHFWAYVPRLTSAVRYVSVMSLTLEMANLDFAPLYGKSFARAGDLESASLMQQILEDEINHVAFGLSWLNKWNTEGESLWDRWEKELPAPMTASRAKGFVVHEEPRRKAGVPEEWIQKLKKL